MIRDSGLLFWANL